MAVIDHEYSEDQIADSIETDEAASTRAVAEHLVNLGHQRIACLSSREAQWQAWAVRRRECFVQAVEELGGGEVKSWRLNPWGTDGLEVAREILSQTTRGPPPSSP